MTDPQNNIICTMSETDIDRLALAVYTATANALYREMYAPEVEEVDDGVYRNHSIERITDAARTAVKTWFQNGENQDET
ncbi:MAG: hypothetical protein ISN29_06635 [Gammaproteobacteria bacterium AqS3]|nr:hypothetical protein [Gammaproteobacteria bacterium AqS3]